MSRWYNLYLTRNFVPKCVTRNFVPNVVCVDDSVGTIFMSDKMILVAKSCKRICFDGTFYTVTKFFISNYNICKYDHTIPIIHVLMTNKSEELYKACINRVVEIIPDFKPNFAVSDFEIALRNAFQSQFPHIHITGCLFHLSYLYQIETSIYSDCEL